MNGSRQRWIVSPGRVVVLSLALGLVFVASQRTAGQELYGKKQIKGDTIAMPNPGEVESLSVFPPKVHLKGMEDAQQLVVSAQLRDRKQDLTGEVKYEVADSAVIKV